MQLLSRREAGDNGIKVKLKAVLVIPDKILKTNIFHPMGHHQRYSVVFEMISGQTDTAFNFNFTIVCKENKV